MLDRVESRALSARVATQRPRYASVRALRGQYAGEPLRSPLRGVSDAR
jgi:hypothetical protein